jgi:hypothetical protein
MMSNNQVWPRLFVGLLIWTLAAGCTGDIDPPEDGPRSIEMQRSALHTNETQLSVVNSAWDERFGTSAAINGDTAAVGVPGYDDSAGSTGAVEVYVRNANGWSLEQRIVPTNANRGDRFGQAISVDADTLAVSAPGDDTAAADAGAVYVYTRTGSAWSLEQTLTINNAAADDELGKGPAVSVFGDRLAVGAYEKGNVGAAFLFERSSNIWTQVHKFSHNANAGGFGVALAGHADTVVIGASAEENSTGRAYVYEWDGTTWSESAQLVAGDRQSGDYYGVSVDITGDLAVVGATSEDEGGASAGAAYVYERSAGTWSQAAKLTASDASTADSFGRRVTVDGVRVGVTAPKQGFSNFDQGGATYLFEQTGSGWVEQQLLVSSDRRAGDRFGSGLALGGQWLFVGANQRGDTGVDAGAAYLFNHDGTNWSETSKLVPQTGEEYDIYSGGIDMSGDTVVAGSQHDSQQDYQAGAAHLYEHDGSGWGSSTRIADGNGGVDDRFGAATALDGDLMAIGQPTAQSYVRGTVFLYGHTAASGWSQVGSINGDNVEADRFGKALDLEGTRLAVGAPWDGDGGALYVFDHSMGSWSQSARLIPMDNGQYDVFGGAVDLGSDRLVVGATDHDLNGVQTGAAYVYDYAGAIWTEAGKLVGSDSASYDSFGEAVAVDAGLAAVGAPGHDAGGETNAGAVYLFQASPNGWTELVKLTANTPQRLGAFGTDVALRGDYLYVGAPRENTSNSGTGAVYVFKFDGTNWMQIERIEPGNSRTYRYFGAALALDGSRLAVMGTSFHYTGGAYVYELSTPTTGGDAGLGDTGGDAASDAGDAGVDASVDAGSDASPDTSDDAGSDAVGDASVDTSDDAGGDAVNDAGLDAGGDDARTSNDSGTTEDTGVDVASSTDSGSTDSSIDVSANGSPDAAPETSNNAEDGCGCSQTNAPGNGILAGFVLLAMIGLRRLRRLTSRRASIS